MSIATDVTIVGGGIMGMLTAYECRRAGASVTLIEKNLPGQESSWAGGGILLPIYPWRQHAAISQLVMQSLKLYPALMDDLQNNSGIDPEFIQSGMLLCKNPDFAAAVAWCEQYGVAWQTPPQEVLAPLASGLEQPLWLPTIRQARNPRLLKALYLSLCNLGVQVISQCSLQNLEIKNNRVHAIHTSLGDFPVNQLVITTGAWSGDLWQQLLGAEQQIKIKPAKGQMLLFAAKPDTLTTMVLDGAHYLIPRADGHILVGSSVEYAGFDKTTDLETKIRLQNFAQQTVPALQHYPVVQHWAGLRPGTEHGIPYITQHPELQNLSLNAGHFRNGLTMAPAAAQLLVDLLLQRTPAISPLPYQLDSLH